MRWLFALWLALAVPAQAAEGLRLDVQLHELAEDRRPALERLTRDAARAAESDLMLPLEGTLHVDYVGSPESFRQVLASHGAMIADEVLALSLEASDAPEGAARADAVHGQAHQQATHGAPQLEHGGQHRGAVNAEAGVFHHGRQPAGGQIDHQQTHEIGEAF